MLNACDIAPVQLHQARACIDHAHVWHSYLGMVQASGSTNQACRHIGPVRVLLLRTCSARVLKAIIIASQALFLSAA
jgi:hypothetical protein